MIGETDRDRLPAENCPDCQKNPPEDLRGLANSIAIVPQFRLPWRSAGDGGRSKERCPQVPE